LPGLRVATHEERGRPPRLLARVELRPLLLLGGRDREVSVAAPEQVLDDRARNAARNLEALRVGLRLAERVPVGPLGGWECRAGHLGSALLADLPVVAGGGERAGHDLRERLPERARPE